MNTKPALTIAGLLAIAVIVAAVETNTADFQTSGQPQTHTAPATGVSVLSQFIPPGPPSNPFVSAPASAAPVPTADRVFGSGFWQSELNGATGRGQCNGDRVASRYTPQGDQIYLQGMNGSAANFPPIKHVYAQISADTYGEDIAVTGRPPNVRIIYRVIDSDMVIRERVDFLDTAQLARDFGSIDTARKSYRVGEKINFYRCR